MDPRTEEILAELAFLRHRCAALEQIVHQAQPPSHPAPPRSADRALLESQKMLQLVLDTIPARVFWKDMDLRFLGCNRAFAADAGVASPDAIIGKSDFEMVWADQAELYRQDDIRVIESGIPRLNYEEPQTSPSGERIWLRTSKIPLLDVEGKTRGVLGTYEEITERKRAEEALRLSEQRLELAVRGAELGTWDWDVKSGAAIFDERWAQMLGYELAELPLHIRTWEDLVHPDDLERMRQVLDAHIEGRAPLYQCEYRLRTKSGEWKWILASGRAFDLDELGRPVRAVGVHLDISSRKQAEEERQRLDEQMQQAQKFESLGVLAGGIAHDFNNLLTAILGNAELALRAIAPDSTEHQNLVAIKTTARRAADLCKQMLAYSGKGHFVVQPLNLREVVEEMAHMLGVSISKKAELVFDFASDLPAIDADESQLRQVILNLIINASEALGDRSGVITLSTGQMWCTRALLSSEPWFDEQTPEGQYVFLEVVDTGGGMNRETLARVFDPFFSTKFVGRGLGLATVHGIVRGHHGVIKVSSTEGKGSTFRVLFPASLHPPAAVPEEDQSAEDWRGNGTVLLVDDEPPIRQVGEQILNHLGFNVVTAIDGLDALRVFQAHKDEIVCVILDMTMPGMEGEETFRELRRTRPEVKVMLSSGYAENHFATRFAGDAPPAGFIHKPYTIREFANKLRAALDDENTGHPRDA